MRADSDLLPTWHQLSVSEDELVQKEKWFEFFPNVPQSYLQRHSLHNSELFAISCQ